MVPYYSNEAFHFSRCADAVSVFPLMFPDSEIASKMRLQRHKTVYFIVNGLAPYFQRELKDVVEKCDHIVIGLDESLNEIAKKQQLDVVMRYWDSKGSEVS